MKKHKILCIALLISMVLQFSGCATTPIYNIPSETTVRFPFNFETFFISTEPTVTEPVQTEPIQTAPSPTEPPRTDPAQTELTHTEPTHTEPTVTETEATEPAPPEFTDLVSLSFYLNYMKAADVFDIRFQYSGSDLFDAGTIARMTNACYITYFEENGLYELNLTEYPGDRIVDAWLSDNTDSLSEDELYTLNVASEIVAQAASSAETPIELEMLLHDYLVETVTYSDNTRDVVDPLSPPRNLTAVGALLDGYANCQGYTDAFYVLASMAGFEVGRMSVYTPDDLHSVNTILLDENWYVVDVTFDDCDNEGSNYRLFNAGVDVIHEYTWHDYNRFYPISAESNENYYYIRYDLVYSDVNALAADIASAYANGEGTVFRAMVLSNDNSDEFNTALYDELMKYNVTFDYTYWYSFTGQDMVYTVYFE